jgi:uncharacterized protein
VSAFRTLAFAGLVLAGLGGPLAVRAQNATSPDALAAAQELFSVMSTDMMEQMVQQGLTQIWPPMEQALRGKNPDIDATALSGLRDDIARIYRTSVSDALRDAPAIYARYFTAQELRDIMAFNKTPTGVKALATMPKIMGEIMKMLVAQAPAIQAQLNTAIVGAVEKRGLKL